MNLSYWLYSISSFFGNDPKRFLNKFKSTNPKRAVIVFVYNLSWCCCDSKQFRYHKGATSFFLLASEPFVWYSEFPVFCSGFVMSELFCCYEERQVRLVQLYSQNEKKHFKNKTEALHNICSEIVISCICSFPEVQNRLRSKPHLGHGSEEEPDNLKLYSFMIAWPDGSLINLYVSPKWSILSNCYGQNYLFYTNMNYGRYLLCHHTKLIHWCRLVHFTVVHLSFFAHILLF